MTYVVCEPCHDCKYTDCCVVCPVDCFFQDDVMLYIHPNDCIDCEACVPECPVAAIFSEPNVPAKWAEWTKVNADKAEEFFHQAVMHKQNLVLSGLCLPL